MAFNLKQLMQQMPQAAPPPAAPPPPPGPRYVEQSQGDSAPYWYDTVEGRYYDYDPTPLPADGQSGYGGMRSYRLGRGGSVLMGLRGANDNILGVESGGENAKWVRDEATGKDVPAFRGPDGGYYRLDDLQRWSQQTGQNWQQLRSNGQDGDIDENTGLPNMLFDTSLHNARPSNDPFTGQQGWGEIAQIAAMAAPVVAPALLGAAAGAPGAVAGTAAFEGGAGALAAEGAGALGAGALEGAAPALTEGSIAENFGNLIAEGAGDAPISGGGGVASGSGGPMMPPAIPPADPTFGGLLSQTAPGVFEAAAPIGAGPLGAGASELPPPGPEIGQPGGIGPDIDLVGPPSDGQPPAPAPESPAPPPPMGDILKNVAIGGAVAGNVAAIAEGNQAGQDEQAAADQMQSAEDARLARVKAARDSVNNAFAGFDDNYFRGIADAYKNYQTPLFADQVAEARRRLPMTVPHTQSSAYNRRAAGLEPDILREESNIGRNAIEESNRRRGEVDYNRNELLGLADSGDVESASSQAAARAQSLSAPPEFSPIADLFGKYTTNLANAAVLGRQAPKQQVVRPLTFSHSPSRSQRIVD